MNNQQMHDRLLEWLAALLAAHGVETSRQGEWLVPTAPTLPPLRAYLEPREASAHGTSARLDVQVAVSEESWPVESFAGLGVSHEDAARNALENFCTGSFHVLLGAFYGLPDQSQVTIEQWQLSGVEYDATLGNYTTRSFDGLGTPIPEQVFPLLESMIRDLPGTEPLYWVRLFYCNLTADQRVTEVLLNNEPWQPAQAAIAGLPWESRDSYYSARLFLVLQRRADSATIPP